MRKQGARAMRRRIISLFNRYVGLHGSIESRGFPLKDLHGQTIGSVDIIRFQAGNMEVEGWSSTSPIGIVCGLDRVEVSPSLTRVDVANRYPQFKEQTVGFYLKAAYQNSHIGLYTYQDGERLSFEIPKFGRYPLWRMRFGQVVPFVRKSFCALPAALRWFMSKDISARSQIKEIFGLNGVAPTGAVNPSLFNASETLEKHDVSDAQITIVLPVYNAFDLLSDVLQRVLDNTDLTYRMIVVEDKSSDPQVRPYLRDWYAGLDTDLSQRVEVLENVENLGFIRSVNRALERAIEFNNHVVLLNSDAFVPERWASRLVEPVFMHENIATVTPMSNDAEIFNVPVICQRSALAPGVADLIDIAAQKLSSAAIFAEAPTGVGFCMLMNIEYLKLEPQLDTIFGKGYGEEVDWCQRVTSHGGRHLGHAGVFVEHRGGTSFGSEEKLKLIRNNNGIVSCRYPDYDQRVQNFIHSDPMSSPRLALAFSWANAQAINENSGPVPIYFAHSMGGGAEHYLEKRVQEDLSARSAAIVIRFGGSHRWNLEVHSKNGLTTGAMDDEETLHEFINMISHREVVYSCGVGDRDPIQIPALLRKLSKGPNSTLDILIHDFFPLSPSYTLLNEEGTFSGVPTADSTDPAHQNQSGTSKNSLAEWREAWSEAMAAADQITAFSQSSHDLVLKAYPEVSDKIRIKRHKLLIDITRVDESEHNVDQTVIGVLGNIGFPKGAKFLEDFSNYLEENEGASLVVIGDVDPAYQLAASTTVHGPYERKEFDGLVREYGITDWLIPSIWPETFSYTTHEAIATGLPVVAFGIGAQGDAVHRAFGESNVLSLTQMLIDPHVVYEQIVKPK